MRHTIQCWSFPLKDYLFSVAFVAWLQLLLLICILDKYKCDAFPAELGLGESKIGDFVFTCEFEIKCTAHCTFIFHKVKLINK